MTQAAEQTRVEQRLQLVTARKREREREREEKREKEREHGSEITAVRPHNAHLSNRKSGPDTVSWIRLLSQTFKQLPHTHRGKDGWKKRDRQTDRERER